jgi:iron complex transport system substrate-binding protein
VGHSIRWRGILPLCVAFLTGIGPAAAAERIVSLAPSVTEIVFAIGAGDRLVGVSTYCDHPPEALGIPRIGNFLSPNVELILAAKPDLVIGVPSPANRSPVENLERLGLRVLIVDPEGVESIFTSIQTVADAIGTPERGAALIESIRRQMAAVSARLDGVAAERVLMLVGRRPMVAAGAGTYLDELIRIARGVNVAAPIGEKWPSIGIEFVVETGPEVIIDAGMGSEEPDGEGRRGFWQAFPIIPAVRNGRVHAYQAFELLRPGPRVAETLEAVARLIHPERFASTTPQPGDSS